MDGLEIVLGSTLIPRWGAILELAKPETIIRPSPVIPPGEIAIPPGVIIPKTPPGIQVGQQKVEMAENPPAGVNWESPPAPEDLGEDWEETTSKESGKQDIHKEYTNKKTGQKINFDKGDPSKTGWKKVDHYHVRNPVSKNKGDYYLDKYGKPCSKGSEASHLEVVRKVVLREVVIKAKKLNMYQKLKIWYKRDKEKREQEDYIRKGGTMS